MGTTAFLILAFSSLFAVIDPLGVHPLLQRPDLPHGPAPRSGAP